MALLSAIQFAALAASCAPQVAVKDLEALAHVESSFETLALHDNTDRKSYAPPDKPTALALATQLLGAGHSIDAGLMQINSANFRWLDLSLEDAFEACQSIRASAHILAAYSVYNTGNAHGGFANGYVRRVVNAKITQPPSSDADHSPTATLPLPARVTPPDPFLTPGPTPSSLTFQISARQAPKP